MFGFGSSNDNQKQNSWERRHPLERKYGVDEYHCNEIGGRTAHTYGTNDLDYLLERFAPAHSKALLNLGEVMHYKERADLWEGRYHELNEDYKILMKQNEGLQEQIAELAKQLARALDKLKDPPTR